MRVFQGTEQVQRPGGKNVLVFEEQQEGQSTVKMRVYPVRGEAKEPDHAGPYRL